MKNWFTSKTVWFNIFTGIATFSSWALGAFAGNPWLVVIFLTINSLVNIALRFLTDTGLNPVMAKK